MDAHRKHWNEQHQLMQEALENKEYARVVEIFLPQHAMVHSEQMALSAWSFEDEVWQGIIEDTARRIPAGEEHSIAWCIWHIARIEDVVMNVLVDGTDQLLIAGGWLEKLGVSACDTGNAMGMDAVERLSAAVDLQALREYRAAVGRKTRAIVRALPDERFPRKIEPERLRRVADERLVAPEAHEIIEYWAGKTVGGLLAMPPTRHCLVHLNEALRLTQKIK
jgi:hypothetical protein